MSNEIKPCPWCGEDVEVDHDLIGYPFRHDNFRIECRDYSCSIKPSTIKYPTEREAIAAWNRRTP